MDFPTYVKTEGHGIMTRLQAATGLAYSTIHRANKGWAVGYRTAGLLSAATKGRVTIPELCAPPTPGNGAATPEGGEIGDTAGDGGGAP